MYEQYLIWAGFVAVLFFSLPFSSTRKLILELSTWALRLALFALLACGAVLWFRPELLPAEVVDVVHTSPPLSDILPEPGSQPFGLAAATLLAALLLPLLAMLDVTRKLAGWRLRRLAAEANGGHPSVVPAEPAAPVYRLHSDRRGAAETMSQVGSRKPFRVADHLS